MAATHRRLTCVSLVWAVLWALGGCSAPDAADADASAFVDASGLDAGAASDAADMLATDDAAAIDASTPLRVLFLGNSLTYVNDLPEVVRALGAATPGAAVDVDSVTMGGATLLSLWSGTPAQDRLAHGGFGAAVLQGQSSETLTDPTGFAAGAMLFGGAARDVGARPVWFATWSFGPEVPETVTLGAPGDTTRRIEHEYELAASVNGGVVARVGAAWQLAEVEVPGVVLHGPDNLHPSAEGTLLAACVILETLTGQAPRVPDPPPLGVARDTAEALCAIAARVECDEGQFACGGACTDLQSDLSHCGRCGIACGGADPCVRGACGCSAGLTPCGGTHCAGLSWDVANCGGCDVRCPTGGTCTSGRCACPGAMTSRVADPDVLPLPAACAVFGAVPTADCNAAVYARCSALDCYQSGFGPTLVGGFGFSTVCLAGDVRTTSYTALRALMPGCDGAAERIGPNCSAAISRFCVSTGTASGFGPVASTGDEVTVTCLPEATVMHTTFTELAASTGTICDGVMQRWGFECGWASSFFCQHLGHLTGFGPVEAVGDDVDIVCVDP